MPCPGELGHEVVFLSHTQVKLSALDITIFKSVILVFT